MFGKLLKQEWRASYRTQGILALSALGVGLLASGAMRLVFSTGRAMSAEVNSGGVVLMSLLTMVLVACVISLVAYAIAVPILQLVRFYRNKFTDQGYLTFTLPVSTHKILLSSFLSMLIWVVISTVVVIVCTGIFLTLGGILSEIRKVVTTGDYRFFWQMIAESWNSFWRESYLGSPVLLVIQGILSWLAGIMTMLAALTIGASVAKRHKILAAFGIYYGFQVALSILGGITSVVWEIAMINGNAADYALHMNIQHAFQIAVNLVILVGGYLLSEWLLRKKLNLP